MKFTRLSFIFVSVLTGVTSSMAIDVNELTRGGWDCGSKWCYFFDPDGNCDVIGNTKVSVKWNIEPDGCLKLCNAEGDIEYVEIIGSSIHWRDGREGYHRPFADKSSEISRRQGRECPNMNWRAPHSANTLADKLYLKSWMSDPKGVSMAFFSADTCSVSDFDRLSINRKYLWQAVDSESIRLTAPELPYQNKIVKVKMHPESFDLIDNGEKRRFLLNAYHNGEAIATTFDMCFYPLGCHGFFSDSADEIMSYLVSTFSGIKGVSNFSVYIGGHLWSCAGVIVSDDVRSVSYINYPGDDVAIDKSFQCMTTILSAIFPENESTTGDNTTRIFIDKTLGNSDPLVITIAKNSNTTKHDVIKEDGFISLTVRSK